MSTSIRERILEEATLIAVGVAGIGNVHRWKADGTTTFGHLDAILEAGEETKEDSAIGNPGPVRSVLPLTVSVQLFPDETADDDTSELISKWSGLMQNAFLADRTFIETTTAKRLAIDSMPVVVEGPEYADGVSSAAIRVDITYEHDGDSVFSFGTAIPAN